MDQVNYTVQKAWKALHFVMHILKKGNRNTKGFSKKGASLSAEALLGKPGGGLLCWGSGRIWGGGLRKRASLSVEAPLGSLLRGLIYQGCVKALETDISLHRGPNEYHDEIRSPGTLTNSWRAPEMEHLSLWVLCEGNLEGGSSTRDPEGYVEEGSSEGISFHRGPTGEPGRELMYRSV